MMLYRSLVVGLLAACLVMLARQRREIRVVHVPAPGLAASLCAGPRVASIYPSLRPSHRPPMLRVPQVAVAPTLVDVSPLVPSSQLLSLVHLQPTEQIASVDAHPGSYTDVTLRGARGERRVLLLVH
jgi:hypothetical protein|nr:hypothetical protein [Kofleriaceae bacterium]